MALQTDDFTPDSRAEWRRWLCENHAAATGVWLVFWKKSSGQPSLSYSEAVEEALCFGWIDSVRRAGNSEQYRQLFLPRKAGSGWSRVNKERVARLEAGGLLHASGKAKIEAAKAGGSWIKLDEIEDGVIPDDLQAALQVLPGASENFAAFARSSRRGILEWISNARTPATRERRISQTACMAAQNKRAQFDKE